MVDGNTSIVRNADRDGEKGGEDWLAFTLSVPVDLDLFSKELASAAELDAPPGIIGEGSPHRASEKDQVTLWIEGDLNANTVRAVVNKHEVPLNEREQLVKKALAGKKFTDEEMQKAVRFLLIGKR